MSELLEVRVSAPDLATAEQLAETLVSERLAACAQVLPGMVSHYRWEGAVERAAEVLVLFKTSRPAWSALAARVRDLHPYETPEILAVPVVEADEAYAAWLADAVAARSADSSADPPAESSADSPANPASGPSIGAAEPTSGG